MNLSAAADRCEELDVAGGVVLRSPPPHDAKIMPFDAMTAEISPAILSGRSDRVHVAIPCEMTLISLSNHGSHAGHVSVWRGRHGDIINSWVIHPTSTMEDSTPILIGEDGFTISMDFGNVRAMASILVGGEESHALVVTLRHTDDARREQLRKAFPEFITPTSPSSVTS